MLTDYFLYNTLSRLWLDQPTPSVIVQRYKFNSRTQGIGETVATFVTELRRLIEHCQFGQILDDMLQDRLVCGIADSHVQCQLLAEPYLTFKKALELAQVQEKVEKGYNSCSSNAHQLHHYTQPARVSQIIAR